MEKTKNRLIGCAARLALAAAYADTESIHISSYEIEGGYAPVNEGMGYCTSGAGVLLL